MADHFFDLFNGLCFLISRIRCRLLLLRSLCNVGVGRRLGRPVIGTGKEDFEMNFGRDSHRGESVSFDGPSKGRSRPELSSKRPK
jgi:hypothetical protein